MDTTNYSDADNARWTANDYEERARDYIREQRANNMEPTEEGWMERAKDNVSDAWESTKDAVSNAWQKTKDCTEEAWEKTKDTADDAWDATKDSAEDAKNEWNKSTN